MNAGTNGMAPRAANAGAVTANQEMTMDGSYRDETREQRAGYLGFLRRKSQVDGNDGFAPVYMPGFLFDFQGALVEWAVEKGRAALSSEPAKQPALFDGAA